MNDEGRADTVNDEGQTDTVSTAIERAIERLRASKEKELKEGTEAGKAAGRNWAMETASYKELRRVSEIKADDHTLEALKHSIDPDDDKADSEFFDQVFGLDEEPAEEYIGGFIQGAKEFFDEVRYRL
jgi:hypothetical protein